MGDVFPELKQQEVHIRNVIEEEEESFGRTLIKVRMIICMKTFLRVVAYLSLWLTTILVFGLWVGFLVFLSLILCVRIKENLTVLTSPGD